MGYNCYNCYGSFVSYLLIFFTIIFLQVEIDIFDMLDATISTEEIHNRFLEAKKGHEEWLEVQFLEEVSGIGDVTVEKLLKKFRNADKVFSATVEKIAEVLGIPESRARNIRKKSK